MQFVRAALVAAALLSTPAVAQTSTDCNPLDTTCPADSALGKSISVDFRNGAVDSFTASGNPTYGSDGVSFTISQSGDAPTLTSIFYIMFGRVDFTMKAAPGAGIVSTLVLESDDLDEIDMEWLGADSTEVQTNYFGKGMVTDYNRGGFEPNANNQDEFITYTVQWTAGEVVWSVAGEVVRVLTPATADTDQYPQTPMRVKFGAWSGGDSGNSAGTISWARGPTNYADGPFTMVVQSIAVTDFSTGTEYTYGNESGLWESIEAEGGSVNGNIAAASSVDSGSAPAVTSLSPSVPAGIDETGWPWVARTTSSSATPTVTVNGVPSGWTVAGDGKIVPISAAVATLASSTTFIATYSSVVHVGTPVPSSASSKSSTSSESLSSSSASSSNEALETLTTYDQQGFKTIMLVPAGWSTMAKHYDNQGSLIMPTTTAQQTTPATITKPATLAKVTTTATSTVSEIEGAADLCSCPLWVAGDPPCSCPSTTTTVQQLRKQVKAADASSGEKLFASSALCVVVTAMVACLQALF